MGKYLQTHLVFSLFLHLIVACAILLSLQGDSSTVVVNANRVENISLSEQLRKVIKGRGASPSVEPIKAGEAEVPAQASGVENSSPEMALYLRDVIARIDRVKHYPDEARFNEQEGVAEVLVEVAADGKVLHAELSKSTPFESLNQAALDAIQKIGALPPSPSQRDLRLRIPVQFLLQ